jgi:hypothetical protein
VHWFFWVVVLLLGIRAHQGEPLNAFIWVAVVFVSNLEHELGQSAVKNTELLLSVARHKEVFFPAAWARYADAKPGTLRIVPPDTRLPELEQDYRKMQEMIIGEPPAFEQLMDVKR